MHHHSRRQNDQSAARCQGQQCSSGSRLAGFTKYHPRIRLETQKNLRQSSVVIVTKVKEWMTNHRVGVVDGFAIMAEATFTHIFDRRDIGMETLRDNKAWLDTLERDGYTVLSNVFSNEAVTNIVRSLEDIFGERIGEEASIRGDEGVIYAARNILTLWPEAADVWRVAVLMDSLTAVLGPSFGLVRILFFDKPPGQTWALPWHKDLTIAVRDNQLLSREFTKPTRKAGVPHVEAPQFVLESMLTVRIHLDEATMENGPLKVVPGSHRTGKTLTLDLTPPVCVLAKRGDVLLMRPLLAHCSGKSHLGTERHRRVLHLEFAASLELPDGYAWYEFVRGRLP
jgi:ectoine hydroxylase-related dioxygenase (phytanoyl-CoA dioxygenase family)